MTTPNRSSYGWADLLHLLLLGCLVPLTACGPGDGKGERLGLVYRFLEQDPERLHDVTAIAEVQEVFRWSPADPDESVSWKSPARSRDSLTLTRRVRLEAGEVDQLVVILASLEPSRPVKGNLALFWASPGEPLAPERRLVTHQGRPGKGGGQRFDFRLGEHPQWRGRIGRLTLSFTGAEVEAVRLQSVAGYSLSPTVGFSLFLLGPPEFDFIADDSKASDPWEMELKPPREPNLGEGDPARIWPSKVVTRETDLQAERIDVVDAAWKVPVREGSIALALRWAGPGEEFTPEKVAVVRQGWRHPDGNRGFRIHLADHPAWKGRVARLGLRLYGPTSDRAQLVRLTGRPLEPRVGELEAAAEKGLKIGLDDELHSSLLALPGAETVREVQVPRGGRLRVSYAVKGDPKQPVRFQVEAAVSGRKPRVLFEDEVASEEDRDHWHRVEVPLPSSRSRPVRLILRTTTDLPLDPRDGLPLWGNPEVLAPERRESPPNVLLVSVDTLRADRLSLYGYPRLTTPELEAWAGGTATVFLRTVAPAPWTLPSHVSMLSGLNAHRHGVSSGTVPRSLPLLSQILRQAGFATLAVTAGGFLDPSVGFARGFDRYRSFRGRKKGAGTTPADKESELEEGVGAALRLLTEYGDRPFFLFFHTYEVHQPYFPRQPWFGRFSGLPSSGEPKRIPRIRRVPENGFFGWKPMELEAPEGVEPRRFLDDLYDSGVAYVDDRLGELLRALVEAGLAKNTIVAVTSDHGELLGEDGLAGHYYLRDENLLVPLIVADPSGRGAGLRVQRQVRLVDLAPTLLDLAGLPVPGGLDGVSLRPVMEGIESGVLVEAWSYAPASNQGLALRLGNRWKYVYNDTAWPPLQGEANLYEIGAEGEWPVSGEGGPDPDRLMERSVQTLEASRMGLGMRFENPEGPPLRGTIWSELILPSTVKSTDLLEPWVSWKRRGELEFSLPAGAEFRLDFERLPASSLRLRLTPDEATNGPGVFDHTFTLGGQPKRARVALVGSEWQTDPAAEEETRTTVSWYWPGSGDLRWADLLSPDEQLQDRLRALGYLD